ncbi:MAG TPA: DUF2231 domain-containing protein [Acidimicrobiales bacterium]|nr:DUF2231 domain-containing protein [Acidimicrobiales bacterium]
MPPAPPDDDAQATAAPTDTTGPADEVDARRRAAKVPTSPVAGPVGGPLHPLVVSIPIGAWVLSFAFDLAAHAANEELVYARAAFWLIGAGIVGGVAAAATGALDLLAIPRGTPAWRTGVRHLVLSDLVLVSFVVSFLLRRDDSLQAAGVGVLALSVAALALLAVSAWQGLRLAFRYGVRVADEDAQRAGFALLGERADRAADGPAGDEAADDDADSTARRSV